MHRSSVTIILLLAAICVLPLWDRSCTAGTTPETTLRVVFNAFPPMKMRTADGGYGGSDIELVRLLAQRMGLALKFYDYPFARGLHELEKGNVDLAMCILRCPQRETYLLYLEPPYKTRTNKAFYVRAGDRNLIRSYDDLNGLTIGVINGGRYFKRFDADTALRKDMATSNKLNRRKLLCGRIDTYIATEMNEDYNLQHRDLGDRIMKSNYVVSKPQNVYMVLSRKSPFASRIEEFNRQLRALVEDGALERIRDRIRRGQKDGTQPPAYDQK